MQADTQFLSQEIKKYPQKDNYDFFDETIKTFINANKTRLNFIKDEAFNFVQNVSTRFEEDQMMISFSGGKDSTAIADVVVKALSNPYLTHIFGNTTLEFPETINYAERFRKNHQMCEFRIAKNEDQNFYEVCEDIGPPARMMRWCCSMFKTGPITRVLNRKFGTKQILTFYGIRK